MSCSILWLSPWVGFTSNDDFSGAWMTGPTVPDRLRGVTRGAVVEFGREAKAALEAAGASVLYREAPMPHTIEPAFLPEIAALIRDATSA